EDGRLELYDLAADPSQQKNLATAEPEQAQLLHKRLLAWRQNVSAKMPAPNTNIEAPAVTPSDNALNKTGQGKGKGKKAKAKAKAAADE
ncbi:MAG: aryl-sulfate sulfohydrolase, partial [Planctomycetaceae bacterium]